MNSTPKISLFNLRRDPFSQDRLRTRNRSLEIRESIGCVKNMMCLVIIINFLHLGIYRNIFLLFNFHSYSCDHVYSVQILLGNSLFSKLNEIVIIITIQLLAIDSTLLLSNYPIELKQPTSCLIEGIYNWGEPERAPH